MGSLRVLFSLLNHKHGTNERSEHHVTLSLSNGRRDDLPMRWFDKLTMTHWHLIGSTRKYQRVLAPKSKRIPTMIPANPNTLEHSPFKNCPFISADHCG